MLEIFPVTCILFSGFCMVDQTLMYPSSISPLGLFQETICNIVWSPFIYRGLGFFKNIKGSRFSCKNGGFCSSNALYSASLSFRMFIISSYIYLDQITLLLRLVKMKLNKFATWVYFCFYPVLHWGNMTRKVLPKAGGLEKIS